MGNAYAHVLQRIASLWLDRKLVLLANTAKQTHMFSPGSSRSLFDVDCFITDLVACSAKQNFPTAAKNLPCSRTALAPCGKDVAVGVSSSNRLVCGSDRPSKGFAGPLFSLWPPLPALCHALWRPWDLDDTQRREHLDSLKMTSHPVLQPPIHNTIFWLSTYGKCVARGITVVMDEEARDM